MKHKMLRIGGAECRGTVSVEAALVTPLLLTLLFGIIEFGFLFKNLLVMHQGAREGTRVAAIGATTTDIDEMVHGSLPTLNLDDLVIQQEYRTFSDADGWSSWTALGDHDGENWAPAGSQIRIALTYEHPLLAGPFFSRVFGEAGDTTITLNSGMIMIREQ